jgi:hypothetical protein
MRAIASEDPVILPLATFVQLATACGPSVHVETLASVAHTESRFDTLAIHDNATGRTYHPATQGEAIRIATDLVVAKLHSTDLGLMQINSANLSSLGMTIPESLDACKSIAAGARVLVAGYQGPITGGDVQPALLRALFALQYRASGSRFCQRLCPARAALGGADRAGDPSRRHIGATGRGGRYLAGATRTHAAAILGRLRPGSIHARPKRCRVGRACPISSIIAGRGAG